MYKNHVTNTVVRREIQPSIGEYDLLLAMVKKRKLGCLAISQGVSKDDLQCTANGKTGHNEKKMHRSTDKMMGIQSACCEYSLPYIKRTSCEVCFVSV